MVSLRPCKVECPEPPEFAGTCGFADCVFMPGSTPYLELARIGSQLLVFDSATCDQTAAPPLFHTFTSCLSAQPLSATMLSDALRYSPPAISFSSHIALSAPSSDRCEIRWKSPTSCI